MAKAALYRCNAHGCYMFINTAHRAVNPVDYALHSDFPSVCLSFSSLHGLHPKLPSPPLRRQSKKRHKTKSFKKEGVSIGYW